MMQRNPHSGKTSIQWSDAVQVDFSFSNGEIVRADRRVLVARSKYFAAMLNEGYGLAESTGSVVDLTKSPVEPAAFRAILAYLVTDCFDPLNPGFDGAGAACSAGEKRPGSALSQDVKDVSSLEQAMHAVDVAEFADQYQLPRLAKLAEAFVLNYALNDRTALQLLARVAGAGGSGGSLERACWSLLTDRGRTILETAGRAEVAKFCTATPALAAELLFHAFNASAGNVG